MLIVAVIFALLATLGWAGAFLLELEWLMPAAFTGFLIVLYLIIWGVRRLLALRRQAGIERALAQQASKQAERVSPHKRPEVIELREKMNEAVGLLKRSKIGAHGGRAALYTLPWYVMVGPPAAGKTTAIGESGLTMAGGGQSKVRGTAGTRNCDWWFTRDAILLDTAGRFAMQEDDQDEWHAFLDMLRRFRKRRPIDGVIVAVSIGDLLGKHEDEVTDLASKLRGRLDELTTRLEMVLPIYVLFTKTDLVSGFVEFFSDYTKQKRSQAWGATFTLDDARLAEPGKAFEAEFEGLVQALHSRLVLRVDQEQQSDTRKKILQFPLEFSELKAPLSAFLDSLCSEDPYRDSPLLRGFYFSSGTQVGMPIEQVLGQMLSSFGLSPPAAKTTPSEARSYFVTDLFGKVIFPDRHVAAHSGSRVRKQQRFQWILVGAAVLLAIAIMVPAMRSFAYTRALSRDTVRDVASAQQLVSSGQPTATRDAIELLGRRVELLETEATKTRWFSWGTDPVPPLLEVTKRRYVRYLRDLIERPVREQLLGQIRMVDAAPVHTVKTFDESHHLMRLFLSLKDPERLRGNATDEELAGCRSDRISQARTTLSAVWQSTDRRQVATQGGSAELGSHACYYLEAAAKDPEAWRWDLSEDERAAVSRAQRTLNSALTGVDGSCLEAVQAKYDTLRPIRTSDLFRGKSRQYFESRGVNEVPGLYTADGWNALRSEFREAGAMVEAEPWVLGRGESQEPLAVCNEESVQTRYFQEYVKNWRAFIEDLSVMRPTDALAAVEELSVLADPTTDGPYKRLFLTLEANLRLPMDEPLLDQLKEQASTADKVRETILGASQGEVPEKKRVISPAEKAFSGILWFGVGDPEQKLEGRLNEYLRLLTDVRTRLEQLIEKGGTPDTELRNAERTVEKLIGDLDPTTRGLLRPLLMNPVVGGIQGAEDATFQALNDSWQQEVWEYWKTNLSGRYPISSRARNDVSLAEFSNFFKPEGGLLWAFVSDKLGGMLDGSAAGYKPSTPAASERFRPGFLTFLGVARQVTDALFNQGEDPQVDFKVKFFRARDTSKIMFALGDTAATYRNGPEVWREMSWPGEDANGKASLAWTGRDESLTDGFYYQGDFSLFRLLESAAPQPTESRTLLASWRFGHKDAPVVKIEFKPSQATHPFVKRFFGRLACPQDIARIGSPN